jgi:hypothetical protein
LEVLGGVLDVDEVVHKIPGRARLVAELVGLGPVIEQLHKHQRTGQVPPEMIRSKERASGMP